MALILIVDDHAENREFLANLLAYRGHRTMEASDGAIGLTSVRAGHPDLVICDVVMPIIDGFEFVRQVRADPAIAATQVIFYTAHYRDRGARDLAASRGISHVIVKPAEPEEILKIVDDVLAHAKAAPKNI
jgi:CheY-like chemotaxis protein